MFFQSVSSFFSGSEISPASVRNQGYPGLSLLLKRYLLDMQKFTRDKQKVKAGQRFNCISLHRYQGSLKNNLIL